MIDAKQIRAARALLEWTREDLARYSGISKPALTEIETSRSQPRAGSADKIAAAFIKAGVIFTEGSGVRLRSEIVSIATGPEALKNIFDSIYEFASKAVGRIEMLCSGFNVADFFQHLEADYIQYHSKRMSALKNLFFRTLIAESDTSIFQVTYNEYRKLPDQFFLGAPFYVYGDNLVMISWDHGIKVIYISEKSISEVYKKQFEAMWKISRPIDSELSNG